MALPRLVSLPFLACVCLFATDLAEAQSRSLLFKRTSRRIGGAVSIHGTVHTVNDGGGADFLDLQAAVDAAFDGDTILVQSGRYGGVTIDDKELTITGEAGASFDFRPQSTIEVRNLSADKSVLVRGLAADVTHVAPRLVLTDNVGVVLFEDLRFASPVLDVSSGVFTNSDVVVLVRCDFDGGYSLTGEAHGIEALNCNLSLYNCNVTTDWMLGESAADVGRPGAAALLVNGCDVFLSTTVLQGPDAADCGPLTFALGDGGPGLEAIASDVEVAGAVILGGAGGGDGFFCDITNDGPNSVLDGSSTFVLLGETPRSYEISSPLREGESGSHDATGPMGEAVTLRFDTDIELALVGMITGPVFVPAPDSTLSIGTIPGTGSLQASFTAPNLPRRVSAVTTVGQGVFTAAASVASDVSVGIVLDQSLPVLFDDLGTNGTEDLLDITAGTLLDCNRNGVPDGGEVLLGAVADCNADGVPDTCEVVALEHDLLEASDASTGDGFGYSVAMDGGYAAIGAYQDSETFSFQGSCYVFELDGSGLWPGTETVRLTSPSPGMFHRFGWDVAIDGDFLVVGSPERTVGDGSAFVYERIAGVWTFVQELFAADLVGVPSDFGLSVAIDGDTIAVGAPMDGNGSVYVFTRSMGGSWVEEQKLTASDGLLGDNFGLSLALQADRLVIGAPLQDEFPFEVCGAAYLFERSASVWSENTKFELAAKQSNDRYGLDVALDGDTIAVGTNGTTPLVPLISTAFLYEFDGLAWVEQAPIVPDPVEALGFSLALEGDTLAVAGGAGAHLFVRAADGSWEYRSKMELSGSTTVSAIDVDQGVFLLGSEPANGTVSGSGAAFPAVPADCNGNGVPDACDLAGGGSLDTNANGVPDECDL